jgi:hypothetical protein
MYFHLQGCVVVVYVCAVQFAFAHTKCIMITWHMISPPAVRSSPNILRLGRCDGNRDQIKLNDLPASDPSMEFTSRRPRDPWPNHLLRPPAQTGPSQPLVCALTTCLIQESSFSWTMSTPSESCITRPSPSSNGYT